jgi:hypothetical protein
MAKTTFDRLEAFFQIRFGHRKSDAIELGDRNPMKVVGAGNRF